MKYYADMGFTEHHQVWTMQTDELANCRSAGDALSREVCSIRRLKFVYCTASVSDWLETHLPTALERWASERTNVRGTDEESGRE